MFTGLVEEVGSVIERAGSADGLRLRIGAATVIEGTRPGDSIAVDGACLTVIALDGASFTVDVVAETVRRTTIGTREPGDRVNLERAMRLGDRLGGHLVQGHVDGVGAVDTIRPDGDGVRMGVRAPAEVLRAIVPKGSITVDGVSLTVAARTSDGFEVALIPHTLEHTTLGRRHAGDGVNLEADVVAKYVEALHEPYAARERDA